MSKNDYNMVLMVVRRGAPPQVGVNGVVAGTVENGEFKPAVPMTMFMSAAKSGEWAGMCDELEHTPIREVPYKPEKDPTPDYCSIAVHQLRNGEFRRYTNGLAETRTETGNGLGAELACVRKAFEAAGRDVAGVDID